ncbi:MAG: hypothetical protein U0Q15_19975 [Kineosporiaceae bacterium]
MRASRTGHSPDRKWWHDGTAWLAAVSADGRERFDGTSWRPNRRAVDVPLLVLGVLALVFSGLAWVLLVILLVSDPDPDRPAETPAPISPVVVDIALRAPLVGLLLAGVGVALIAVRPVRRIRPGDRPPA